jgi:hypothetical protein
MRSLRRLPKARLDGAVPQPEKEKSVRLSKLAGSSSSRYFAASYGLERKNALVASNVHEFVVESRFDSSTLALNVVEDECGDEQAKKDFNNEIANLVGICIEALGI